MKSPLTLYRETHGKTLAALGELFGVNKSTVLRWEAGGVPMERLADVSRLTGISKASLRPDVFSESGASPEAA